MPKGFAKMLKDLLRRPDVSPVAKLTYAFLLDAMRNRGVCQYGVRAIAAGIGVYRDRVTKAVGELEAAGLLLVERRIASGQGRGGTRLTTVYRLPDSVLKTGTPERHENRDAQKSIASRKPGRSVTKTVTVASRFPGHDKDKKTNKKTSPTGTATAPTKQQVLFKAITEVFGWEPITDRDKKRVGALARDFALKGATPPELGIRVGRYRKAWPNCTCTPEAVLKHWHVFEKDEPHGNNSGRTNGSPARVTASADKRSRYAALTG